jgi:hypothetical protein
MAWHYRVAGPDRQAGGPIRQPYAIVDNIPLSGTKNLSSGIRNLNQACIHKKEGYDAGSHRYLTNYLPNKKVKKTS